MQRTKRSSKHLSKHLSRYLWLLFPLLASCNDSTAPDRPAESPHVDRFLFYATNWPAREEVELAVTRNAIGSTVVLFRPARPGNPRIVLDSVGPRAEDAPEVRELLDTFDVWALNAPNAPGAACRTVNGQWTCNIASQDYSIVMLVESGDAVRVQRYTGLETSSGHPTARALGDFVLAWARRRAGGG